MKDWLEVGLNGAEVADVGRFEGVVPEHLQGAAVANPSRWVLSSLALVTLMASLATSIANVGLPAMAKAFDASFQAVQWIVLAYLLAITALIVGAGRLGDLIGRRRLLLVGISLFTAASLMCGASPSLGLLIAARASQGVGAAIMMALAMALVGETVPKARTGRPWGCWGRCPLSARPSAPRSAAC